MSEASERETVFILAVDYGYEGLQEPFIAFRSKGAAERAQQLMRANPSSTSTKIVEAEVWEII